MDRRFWPQDSNAAAMVKPGRLNLTAKSGPLDLDSGASVNE